jgi:hypothetical protein
MHSNRIIRAATIVAGVSLVAGCRETSTALPQNTPVAAQLGAATAPAVRVRERNKLDWVGLEHNKMINAWREEMRKPGVLTHNLCSHVVDFVTRDERLPVDKRPPLPVRRQAIAAAVKSSTLCQRLAEQPGMSALASRRVARKQQGSAAIAELQTGIENALLIAPNRDDLAVRLNAILDASATLDETEQTIVAATASVAQNSFEYWETEFEPVVEEVGAEYGPCAADRRASGYTMDGARASCLTGDYFLSSFGGWSPGSLLGPTSLRTTALRCGPGLRDGFKHVAKGDARGAFAGAWAGAFGAAAGIVGGAILGAASGSIWAAGENAWSTYWCLLQ